MPSKKSTRFETLTRYSRETRVRAMGLAVGVLAVAMLIGAGRTPKSADVPAPTQPETAPVVNPTAKTTKKLAATRAPANKPAAATNVARADAVPSGTTGTTSARPGAATSEAPVEESTAVTITGCLEQDDEMFRLKDATGIDAPKSRSWKSGFLKKRAASIELVDAVNRVKLASHVGERVSVTGMLTDREIEVRSLKRVGASCG
jgi:hypothetical protein